MDRIGPARDDGLAGVLRDVNVRSVVYCLSDFSAPWGFSVESSPAAKFHVVLRGAAWLAVGGTAPVPVRAGDLVLLPFGEGHVIADQPESPVRRLDAILAEYPVDPAGRLAYGSGPAASDRVVVAPGDTVWSIAAAHYRGDPRPHVEAILLANRLQTPLLRPGQSLQLPRE